ncbi:MAG: BBE domain-containing protein [Cyanobacteriota bacterium]
MLAIGVVLQPTIIHPREAQPPDAGETTVEMRTGAEWSWQRSIDPLKPRVPRGMLQRWKEAAQRDPDDVVAGRDDNDPDVDLGSHQDGGIDQALWLDCLDHYRQGPCNLVAIKQRWDPDNLFHHAQSIPTHPNPSQLIEGPIDQQAAR